jgi:hypothetical protein
LDPAAASILTTALSRIADGSLGEAGAGLWRSLTSLVKSTLGHEIPTATVSSSGQLTAGDVPELTAFLFDQAAQHPALHTALDAWLQRAAIEVSNVQASNTIVGDVSDGGKVIQAGHIHTVRFD